MDNLGVRLPVDATAKSKFKSEGLTSHMKEEMTVDSRKVHREIIGYWSQITIRAQ
jgi:hypothetical protein